jgi:hypothetical protein
MANSVTFAQFVDSGSQNFTLTNNIDGSQTISTSEAVSFSYSNVPGLPATLQGPLSALFTLTANSIQNVGIVNISGTRYAYINGWTGSFQFIGQSGVATGQDLLSGSFSSQSVILGVQGGQSASFSDSSSSAKPSEVIYSSGVVRFLPQQENFSLSLSSIFDTLQGDAGFNVGGAGNTNVDNFTAALAGTFASDPAPVFASENGPINYVLGGLLVLLFAALLRRLTASADARS